MGLVTNKELCQVIRELLLRTLCINSESIYFLLRGMGGGRGGGERAER